MGRLLRWWCLGLLSLLGLGVQAEPMSASDRVVIVSSGTAGAYAEAAQALVDGWFTPTCHARTSQLTAADMALPAPLRARARALHQTGASAINPVSLMPGQ